MAVAQDSYPASLATAICREPAGVAAAGSIRPPDGSTNSITAIFNYVSADVADADREAAQAENFEVRFYQELKNLRAWSARANWKQTSVPSFQVFVSTEYKISKALVHVWAGHPGRMEFPVRRVISGTAAIAHELAHVLFPNGNRFLAEGLAVYLQAAIGGNPAFPNFGRSLYQQSRELLQEMIPGFSVGNPKSLEQLHLSELDEIATPCPLTLRVGKDFCGEEPRGQARIYSIVGSFVQFLVETRGHEKFNALYEQTPLVPFAQNVGAPDRWRSVYDVSLLGLEKEWKAMIVSDDASTFGKDSVGRRRRPGATVKSQHLDCNRENGNA
jgi:hypothetical protein